MKKIIVLGFSLTSVLLSYSQKQIDFHSKNTIGYANTVFHTMDVFDMKNNKHTLTYQRLINRRTTFVANYAFARCAMHYNLGASPFLYYKSTDRFGRTNTIENIVAKQGNSYYKTAGFSIGFRKFIHRKGSVAPYGTFIELKMGREKITRAKTSDSIVYYSAANRVYANFPNKGINHLDFTNFNVGVGSSKPIAKHLIFTWLLSATLNIPGWINHRSNSVSNEDEYFFRNASASHQTNNYLNLNIGLNYSF
jgi:hypothetical protein